jgi:hypothetical protein
MFLYIETFDLQKTQNHSITNPNKSFNHKNHINHINHSPKFCCNFEPLMKSKLLIAFLLLAIFPCGAQSLMEKKTAKLINDYRQSMGLKTLVINFLRLKISRT